MVVESLLLFLSLASWLVLVVMLLAVYRIYRVNKKIAAELDIEPESLFDFNLHRLSQGPTLSPSYMGVVTYVVLALSIASLLFAAVAFAEGSSEVAAYLFGVSLFAMAVSGFSVTVNSRNTQTVSKDSPKFNPTLSVEKAQQQKPPAEKQSLSQTSTIYTYTYCRLCGYKNESDAVFCRGCGGRIIK